MYYANVSSLMGISNTLESYEIMCVGIEQQVVVVAL